MKCSTIKALKAVFPYATAAVASVLVASVPEIAHAATGFAPADRVLGFIPTIVMGTGGALGVWGIGKSLAGVAAGASAHGDAIISGLYRGGAGGGMFGVGALGTQITGGGSAGFSLLDAANVAHTAINGVAFTGGSF